MTAGGAADRPFDGLAAIVTGGTRGLGRAVVTALHEHGANVLAVGSTAESAGRLTQECAGGDGRVLAVAQDLSDPAAGDRLVAAALAAWGRLDIVVNNAARHAPVAPAGPTRDDWQDLFTVKLLGYWSLMVAAIPELTRTRGSITNVAGVAGIRPTPLAPHSGAVNAAIISLTRSYAAQLAGVGVRVNAVTPGGMDTDRHAARVADEIARTGQTEDEVRRDLGARIPTGAVADPAEVAAAIMTLANPTLRSLTGANIILDGGSSLRS